MYLVGVWSTPTAGVGDISCKRCERHGTVVVPNVLTEVARLRALSSEQVVHVFRVVRQLELPFKTDLAVVATDAEMVVDCFSSKVDRLTPLIPTGFVHGADIKWRIAVDVTLWRARS